MPRRVSVHRLKTAERWFALQAAGVKRFEIRRNDRGFWPGDLILLEEIDEAGKFTGRHLLRRVTFMLDAADVEGLAVGFVILGTESAEDEIPF